MFTWWCDTVTSIVTLVLVVSSIGEHGNRKNVCACVCVCVRMAKNRRAREWERAIARLGFRSEMPSPIFLFVSRYLIKIFRVAQEWVNGNISRKRFDAHVVMELECRTERIDQRNSSRHSCMCMCVSVSVYGWVSDCICVVLCYVIHSIQERYIYAYHNMN